MARIIKISRRRRSRPSRRFSKGGFLGFGSRQTFNLVLNYKDRGTFENASIDKALFAIAKSFGSNHIKSYPSAKPGVRSIDFKFKDLGKVDACKAAINLVLRNVIH